MYNRPKPVLLDATQRPFEAIGTTERPQKPRPTALSRRRKPLSLHGSNQAASEVTGAVQTKAKAETIAHCSAPDKLHLASGPDLGVRTKVD